MITHVYGMVNRSLEELITTRHGAACWERVLARSGVEVDIFVSNEPYDDDITHRLVEATSAELELSPQEVLGLFGEHWVNVTAAQTYGPLFRAGGQDLGEFLQNLPNFHTRVQLLYPNLRPPEFHVRDARPGHVTLEYHSTREGLLPFVIGLVRGLGRHFGTPTTITVGPGRADGLEHDELAVDWTPS
jgi:hypothetical protein